MRLCLWVCITSLWALSARAADFEPRSVLDSAGVVHVLGEPDARATVVVFLGRECPISRAAIPALNALAAQHAKEGVQLFGVISERSATARDVEAFAREYALAFPLLSDVDGALVGALHPAATPEAFVLDRALAVRYRGRVDDRYADVGKPRPAATTHELAAAVAAVLAGTPPPANTEAVGCLVEPPPSADGGAVTFTRDVALLLYASCVKCHHAGTAAPFPLVSYEDARKRAQMLVRVTQSRQMPPWKPAAGFGAFRGDRHITDAQIALLERWADSGAPEGDAKDLPTAPTFDDGWALGEPDLVIEMADPFPIAAGGPDVYRSFVMPGHVAKNQRVRAVEFRPGAPGEVHHALLYLDTSGAARKLDEADPGPGFTNFGGPGFKNALAIGAWAPGSGAQVLPDGMAYPLPAGSDFVFQMHYHPSGKASKDRSKLGLYFARKPTSQVVGNLMIARFDLDIPPGKSDVASEIHVTLPETVTVVAIAPHMHLLGREMKATAKPPKGPEVPLVWLQGWDFNWQTYYTFREPLVLPAGTQVTVRAVFDNSKDNPNNPSDPPRRVKFGEKTTDEMFFCPLQVAAPNLEALHQLQLQILSQEMQQMGRR